MSGHSHYATIHRQKELKDAKKGNVFSKLARAISIAVKAGGGPDPDSNFKLRMVIDKAKAQNMPKVNVERAIASGVGGEKLEEVVYEGFGPLGIAVMVEAATDNRNRTGQEIKNLFDRGGGNMGGPGAVSYNFEQKALIEVKKSKNSEQQILSIIDLGVDEVEETNESIEVYVNPNDYSSKLAMIHEKGFEVLLSEITQKPKNFREISNIDDAKRILSFLDNISSHDDVLRVHSNVDIPDLILRQLNP